MEQNFNVYGFDFIKAKSWAQSHVSLWAKLLKSFFRRKSSAQSVRGVERKWVYETDPRRETILYAKSSLPLIHSCVSDKGVFGGNKVNVTQPRNFFENFFQNFTDRLCRQ